MNLPSGWAGGAALMALLAAGAAWGQSDPLNCAGPAPEAEPGSAAWEQRDLANMLCGEQRLIDALQHPVLAMPAQMPVGDPYREPARHDGVRFRFLETTVTNRNGVELAVEVYRPCAAGACEGMPAELETYEPPYPGILVMHGGYQSRKELHWWATQALAEAGYMTVSLNAIHDDDMFYEDSGDVLAWFTGTPDAPSPAGEYNPFWEELDAERLGIAGHSGGGATANRHGHTDPRFQAIVGWDRSGRYDIPDPPTTPALYLVADHGFTPERREAPPDPDGYEDGADDRGDKHQDFDRLQAAGIDSMKIALRAATHLDWVPMASAASRHGEAVSIYYTLAWFDRYLKGPQDPVLAADAYRRLTAETFDDSADRHNISQGLFDPVAAAIAADPYGGNLPYALAGMPVADRLSFYFDSKCDIAVSGSGARAVSDDMRHAGCSAGSAAAGGHASSGGGSLGWPLALLLGALAVGRRMRLGRWLAVLAACWSLPAAAQPGPGCAPERPAVAHHAGGALLTPQPADAPIPCVTVTGNAIEAATIGVTRSGAVFFGSIEARPDGVRTIVDSSVLARSTDLGASWENVIPGGLPFSPHGSLSTWMSVDRRSSRLWYATPAAPCGAAVSWSDDDGATWGHYPNIGCPAQGAAVLIEGPPPAGTPEPQGYPHIVYYCANAQDGDESVLACHRSRDGGASWQWIGTTPDPIPAQEGCEPTQLRSTRTGEVGTDGVLYFPTYDCSETVLGLAVSADQGASWTRFPVIETEIQDLYPPAMAIDPDNNLFLAWKGPGGLPFVAVSTDQGESWSPALMLAPPDVDEIERLGIVAGGPGHILVSYLATNDDGASFDAYMTESRDALAADPVFWSAIVNAPGESVLDAGAMEIYADRIQFLRGHIAGDGTPWAAFHCFDTAMCPGERLGMAARLVRVNPDSRIETPPTAAAGGSGAFGPLALLGLIAAGFRRRRAASLAPLAAGLTLSGTAMAQTEAVLDCLASAGAAEPNTSAWFARDAATMLCAQQRHLDAAQHPLLLRPTSPVDERGAFTDDPYREPSRHAGVRFRFDELSVTTPSGQALAVEVYRPCDAASCPELPAELPRFEPPYPAVISVHGGASRKELHWWSSQPLAEAGYFVVSFDDATTGTSPTEEQVLAVLDWLLASESEPAASGEFNPFRQDLDPALIGIAGHSAGGVLASRIGQEDARLSAIVSWDRAQSSPMPDDLTLRTPAMFQFADYSCQQVPICQPEPYLEAPPPDGPGNKGEDFIRLAAAGIDTMQIAIRAATHLDWTPPLLAGSRYGELTSIYYTLAWFDRYLRGARDPAVAADAFARLTAATFDASVDIHNLSQGLFDPVQAAASADPYGGNLPYMLAGVPTANRLSFYYLSKCDITAPGAGERAVSDDLRRDPCTVGTDAGLASAEAAPGLAGGGSGAVDLLLLMLLVRRWRMAMGPR